MSTFSPTATSAVTGQAPQGMRDMYDRIVGRQKGSQGTKHQLFSPLKEQEPVVASSNSIKNKFLNLFSKESAQDRMIKSLLKSYKERLIKELSIVSKTYSKKISRVTEQITEFEALETQLLSWGLIKYIPSFKIQTPELFVYSSPEFKNMANKLLRLDVVCSSAIKKF
eukprot:gene32511-42121_t